MGNKFLASLILILCFLVPTSLSAQTYHEIHNARTWVTRAAVAQTVDTIQTWRLLNKGGYEVINPLYPDSPKQYVAVKIPVLIGLNFAMWKLANPYPTFVKRYGIMGTAIGWGSVAWNLTVEF